MSGYLWKAFLEDDVRTFRTVLETASFVARGGNQKGNNSGQHMTGPGIASPGSLIHKENEAYLPSGIILTRADLNYRDSQGRTLLHLIATSKSKNAIEFARVLLEQPLVDIYIQDSESGYTGLHRAFYHGNISVAIVILSRDISDALGGSNSSLHHPGGLIRIKDHEGNGPFDVLEQTLENTMSYGNVMDDEATSTDSDSETEGPKTRNPWNNVFETEAHRFNGFKSLDAHEVYTFGSNKNISLGFGDEDDRQFPERVTIRPPHHLMDNRLEEYRAEHASHTKAKFIPAWIRYRPTLIHNVVMGRFSTAILTNDNVSNLHICGHGSGGRLGLGDERTRFNFTCVETGSLAQKKIVAVALGHHHTLALSEEGEVFSWGSGTYGQLGYALPLSKNKEPVQLTPRQIFGTIKREPVCGIAASGNHSVVHTLDSLYTFGKNEGQLGIVDSDARSLEMQNVPRKVGGVKFSHSIVSVSAIQRATVCLLSSREVWVFANYGYSKITFTAAIPSNWFRSLKETQHRETWNNTFTSITKIATSGDTVCALTNDGQVYSFSVAKPDVSAKSTSSSTTNPSKIRAALSTPQIIWSNRKTRLGAYDMAVDQNGSIIVVTNAGKIYCNE
jgi:alpha-tubulin suppressor-like RCC1 family protein